MLAAMRGDVGVRFSASLLGQSVYKPKARQSLQNATCRVLHFTMIAPRKNIRLARDEYVGRRIYFLTICVEERRKIFQVPARAKVLIDELRKVAARMNVLVHAFCVMPDHVDILVEGKAPGSDLVKFVTLWKQGTGYTFRHELPPRFWQRRFYDHVVRWAEDSESVAWYIWMNPVRKGIVAEPQSYPFSGSFTVEWPKAMPREHAWVPPWKLAAGTR
jgi:putative transposase